MKHKQRKLRNYMTPKKSLVSAICMLIISAILLTTVSFAWITLSIAPEITGVATNIAANGSLEIALLNAATRQDLSAITTVVGGSLSNAAGNSAMVNLVNQTWGNVVDLSDASYGLREITLMPARLNLTQNADGSYSVDTALLSVPIYGEDGRIIKLEHDTISATMTDGKFTTVLGTQDYGVRAIGTSDSVSAQASALALAKANILTYTNSAKTSATSAIRDNFNDLFGLIIAYSANGDSATFDDNDLTVIKNMTNKLDQSLDYIDAAIRQGIIAFAASEISDTEKFNTVRTLVNSGASLSSLLDQIAGDTTNPFAEWISKLDSAKNNVNLAITSCDALTGGVYTWTQLKDALNPLLNIDKIYIGDKLFGNISKDELTGMIGGTIEMTLATGSGVFADVADFTGGYSALLTTMGTDVELEVITTVKPPYLTVLQTAVSTLSAAGGSIGTGAKVTLNAEYGYVLDMAFRTNAPASNLLLQTAAIQRIYAGSTSVSTLGGGSYMEFARSDKTYTLEQMVNLMDAVRVCFVDDKGEVLGMAKLNSSNRVAEGDVVKAPIYLYDFSISEEELTKGALVMGERRKDDNAITALTQNVGKAVSVIVYLDGDVVDNTMFAATAEDGLSLGGTLNLQFASSANLIPADVQSVYNYAADMTSLEACIEENKAIYDATNFDSSNKQRYTASSWKNFVAAYDFAVSVKDSVTASERSVAKAIEMLTSARAGLVEFDAKVVIDYYRNLVGTSTEVARYLVWDEESGKYIASATPTQSDIDAKKVIYGVDPAKNLRDEGEGIMRRIYTETSWSAFANALYYAEAYFMVEHDVDDAETEAEIIDSLETAYAALKHAVLFTPYEYEGEIFYFAISEPEVTDTYGKWYYSNFTRVFSDLLILKLDAGATEVTDIAEIVQDNVSSKDATGLITPYVSFLTTKYPGLANNEFIAVDWTVSGLFEPAMTAAQYNTLKELVDKATAFDPEGTNATPPRTADAKYFITSYEHKNNWSFYYQLYDEAKKVIEYLATDLAKAEAQKAEELAEKDKESTALLGAVNRKLLTVAISKAEALKADYDNQLILAEDAAKPAIQAKIDALTPVITAAQSALAVAGTTNADATECIKNINAELAKEKVAAVTEANTIQIALPLATENAVLEYTNNISADYVYTKGETGIATFEAVVLTRTGVVFKLTKDVAVYEPIHYVDVKDENDKAVTDITIDKLGNSKELTLEEVFEDENASCKDEISSIVVSSSNLAAVSATSTASTITVTANGSGSATVYISVNTKYGEVRTTSIFVTVPESNTASTISEIKLMSAGNKVTRDTLYVGSAKTYTVEAVQGNIPEGETPDSIAEVTASSSNTGVADVSCNGTSVTVNAKSVGEATVSVYTTTAYGMIRKNFSL